MRTFHITRLTLTGFRNYAALRLDTSARLIALTGPNGAGKTNLIEAVSLIGPGRGLRAAGYDELAQQGGNARWAVAAEVDGLTLGTDWGHAGAGGSRRAAIGGRTQSGPGGLAGHMRMLWLTPAMDRMFAGPPADRRRFFDRLVQSLEPAHADHLAAFEKAMRERNLLLDTVNPDARWLSALEASMAEMGAAVAAARLATLDRLAPEIARLPRDGAFPRARASLEGTLEQALTRMPAVQMEDGYRKELHDKRALDRAAGRCLTGPHRSDLSVRHEPKDMAAALCSTGEQKALLIGLILAQAHAVKAAGGAAPLLLLDEIAAHLDLERRAGLFAALGRLGAQCWMTGTDAHLFAALPGDAARYTVDQATLTRHA